MNNSLSDVFYVYGTAVAVLLAVLGLCKLLAIWSESPEVKAAKNKTFFMVQEALNNGKYELLKKCLWFHPEGAGDEIIKVKLFLSNGTTLLFETFNSVGNSHYSIVEAAENIEADELRTRRTSKMIIDFFWEQQRAEGRNKEQNRKNQVIKNF